MSRRYTIKGDPKIVMIGSKTGRFTVPMYKDHNVYLQLKKKLSRQHDAPLINKPVYVTVRFYMPIPYTYSLRRQQYLEECYHYKKPALMQLVGFVSRLLSRAVLTSSSYICSMESSKVYVESINAKTVITVREVDPYEPRKKKEAKSAKLGNERNSS